jgi:hypothetical protein
MPGFFVPGSLPPSPLPLFAASHWKTADFHRFWLTPEINGNKFPNKKQ